MTDETGEITEAEASAAAWAAWAAAWWYARDAAWHAGRAADSAAGLDGECWHECLRVYQPAQAVEHTS